MSLVWQSVLPSLSIPCKRRHREGAPCECFVSAIGLSAWKDAVTFAILIIVLLVKPTGFLGRKVQEKV